MSDENVESLSLAEVKQRFLDSERALNEIAGRLRNLHEAEVSAVDAAGTLSEAGDSLRRYVEASESVVRELANVQEEARKAVSSASSLLQGDDLRALQQSVADLRGTLDLRLSVIEARLDGAERAEGRAKELEAQLAKVLAALSARQRRKLPI